MSNTKQKRRSSRKLMETRSATNSYLNMNVRVAEIVGQRNEIRKQQNMQKTISKQSSGRGQ